MHLEEKPPAQLTIKGQIVQGRLELLSPDKGQSVEGIRFGSTFYGTDLTEAAMLFNNSPEPACFVSILDEDAIGQEVVKQLPLSFTLIFKALPMYL